VEDYNLPVVIDSIYKEADISDMSSIITNGQCLESNSVFGKKECSLNVAEGIISCTKENVVSLKSDSVVIECYNTDVSLTSQPCGVNNGIDNNLCVCLFRKNLSLILLLGTCY
jgi:hypothetical protein